MRGEPSHLPGGSAGRRGARLPQAADAAADELVVFLRRGPRKASVGFILSGRLLSCRTNKAGLKEGCSLRGGSLQESSGLVIYSPDLKVKRQGVISLERIALV